MGDDKAKQRFFQKAEEIEVTFIPQCCSCDRNINFERCQLFAVKPKKYSGNKEICPGKVER